MISNMYSARDAFFEIFEVHPIILHDHASDTAYPILITSLIKHFQEIVRHYDGTAEETTTPESSTLSDYIAVIAGSYSMGLGPLAYGVLCS